MAATANAAPLNSESHHRPKANGTSLLNQVSSRKQAAQVASAQHQAAVPVVVRHLLPHASQHANRVKAAPQRLLIKNPSTKEPQYKLEGLKR